MDTDLYDPEFPEPSLLRKLIVSQYPSCESANPFERSGCPYELIGDTDIPNTITPLWERNEHVNLVWTSCPTRHNGNTSTIYHVMHKNATVLFKKDAPISIMNRRNSKRPTICCSSY